MSIRHNDVVSGFVASVPVLHPQVLQVHDCYVSIDVTDIDCEAVSGDAKSVHTGYRAVIAVE